MSDNNSVVGKSSMKEKMKAALTSAAKKTGEIMWDNTKKGLTTTGKVVVGAAVTATVGAVVYVIKG